DLRNGVEVADGEESDFVAAAEWEIGTAIGGRPARRDDAEKSGAGRGGRRFERIRGEGRAGAGEGRRGDGGDRSGGRGLGWRPAGAQLRRRVESSLLCLLAGAVCGDEDNCNKDNAGGDPF